jgi:hypothetical protein
VQVKVWARENAVPASSVFSALQLGRIARTPDGGIDPDDAASWLRSRRDRADQDHAADAGRQRELDALAAQAVTDIAKLRRQLQELRDATVPADVIQAARSRRQRRLQAAMATMPALHTAEVAQAVGRPPAAVSRALAKLVALVSRDLGGLTGG